MQDQLVLLAKEKGYYSFHTVNREIGNGWFIELCLLQKWLREVHKIDVRIYRDYRFLIKNKNIATEYYDGKDYNSYEKALEKGLQKALKIIK